MRIMKIANIGTEIFMLYRPFVLQIMITNIEFVKNNYLNMLRDKLTKIYNYLSQYSYVNKLN